MSENIRWKQRFYNFEKAFNLLKSVFEEKEINDLSLLEQEGVVQRFEYTYELAWKTLK
ncbi:nucleotidyltransferase substrate binding protein, partial [Brachyspira hampsonii]